VFASELVDDSLWWEGPAWLKGSPKNYPNSKVSKEEELTEEGRNLKSARNGRRALSSKQLKKSVMQKHFGSLKFKGLWRERRTLRT